MTGVLKARFTTILLAMLSLALVVLSALNYQQRQRYQIPDDGVSWTDTDQGVRAWIVDRGGPGDRAGIHEGDKLAAIDGTPVAKAEDVYRAVFADGVWSKLNYELEREGAKFEADLVTVPQDTY